MSDYLNSQELTEFGLMEKSLFLNRFTVKSDGSTISCLHYSPNEVKSSFCIVLSHGLTSSKESMDVLASYLAGKGFPTVTHDFRGHKLGGSTGELRQIMDIVSDTVAVCNAAMLRTGSHYVVPIGHSMGGIISIAVLHGMKNAIGVGVIASGPEPLKGFQGMAGQSLLQQRADYLDGLSPETALKELGQLYANIPPSKRHPGLFIAAKGDVFAKAKPMMAMVEAHGKYAEYAEVDGGHLDAPLRSRGVVARWLEKTYESLPHPRMK